MLNGSPLLKYQPKTNNQRIQKMSTQKTYTEITPQGALRILADAGKPVEGLAFRLTMGEKWADKRLCAVDARASATEFPFYTEGGGWYRYCARVTITSPSASGHNPDKLTEGDCWIRCGGGKCWRRILSITETTVMMTEMPDRGGLIKFAELLGGGWQYSTDNGTTWKPCGTEVQS